MKLIKRTEKFVKEGKEIIYNQYFVVLENGTRVAVKPVYKHGRNVLNAIAEREER